MVPRQVDFKVPKIQCEDADEVPYTDCQDKEKEQMTTKMTCEVKHTTNCQSVTSTKCANINYQECAEVPEENCETVEMQVRLKKYSKFQILAFLMILWLF